MFRVYAVCKVLGGGRNAALAVISAVRSRSLSRWRREMERLRELSGGGEVRVLGIESSCDDTGVAVLGENGRVMGEAIHSQLQTHKQ